MWCVGAVMWQSVAVFTAVEILAWVCWCCNVAVCGSIYSCRDISVGVLVL